MHRRPLLWIIILILLSGCDKDTFTPAGPVADAEHLILLNALAIMLAIIVPVILATLTFAWWFRASNTRARYLPDWSYSGQLELLIWSIPTLTILFLGGICWISSHDLDPARQLNLKEKPLEVQVVSLDWKWLFIYPQQAIASINRLVVPVGIPLHFRITSASVMNVFFVPQLGSEIYAMNGMATQLYLQADRPGTYPGLSAHFSGDGFSTMAFDVNAIPAAEFTAWIVQTQGNGATLNAEAYRGLLKQSMNVSPITYHAVEPGLFDAVVQQELPPGKGPQTDTSASTIRQRRED